MATRKHHKTIFTLLAGFLVGGLVTFLSLGVLTPLGAVLFGLLMVVAGGYLLIKAQSKWALLLGFTLVLSPFFIILAFVVRFVRSLM